MRSLLVVIGVLVTLTAAQRRPPNYSQDEMPDTSFDCRDKVVGGYYADIETDCQMFHVCVKVPGLGIQDYRFLCPNDTTFDQENQICANWYDIDCEASTLYYSDNFDLYRIEKGASPSSKGTPIPLGPSTQRPPVAPPKKRPLIQKQDDEEEFYLQRSETGDRRLQQGRDLLRGSSSGNFFNKNQGKEDDFEDNYQPPKEAKPADVPRRRNQQQNNNKKKVAVRKLRKRPDAEIDVNAQQSYQANPTTAPTAAPTDFTRQSFANQRANTQKYDVPKVPATPAPEVPTTRVQQYQPRYNTINRNTNAPTPTTTQAPTTFYQPSSSSNAGGNFLSRANNRPAFDNQRTNNFAKSTTLNYDVTKIPTTKKYVDNQPRGFEVQKTNTARSSAGIASTTVSYPTNTYQQNTNTNFQKNNNFQQNNNFAKTTFNTASTTYAPVTYSGNYRQNAFAKSTTTQREYQDYNGNYDSYGNQRGNNNNDNQQQQQQNTNNASPQTSDEYVERDSEKEFLKTAPSNNIRPSNFNTFGKNYNANTYNNNYNSNNYTSTTANNNNNNNNNNQGQSFYNQKATTSFNNYDKNTKNDFNTKTTAFNNNNNNNNNNFRSQSTQAQFAATNPTTRRPSTQYYQPSSTQYNQSPSSAQPSSTTYAPAKTSAVRNSGGGAFYQQPSSYSPAQPSTTSTFAPPRTAQRNSGGGAFYQQPANSNTAPPPPQPKKSERPPAEPKKAAPPLKDASYDYAYYDDTDATEYEGTDPISDHHFGKTGDSLKIRS